MENRWTSRLQTLNKCVTFSTILPAVDKRARAPRVRLFHPQRSGLCIRFVTIRPAPCGKRWTRGQVCYHPRCRRLSRPVRRASLWKAPGIERAIFPHPPLRGVDSSAFHISTAPTIIPIPFLKEYQNSNTVWRPFLRPGIPEHISRIACFGIASYITLPYAVFPHAHTCYIAR